MADTENVVVVIDGASSSKNTLVAQNSSGAVAAQSVLRANSAIVDDTNPLPTQTPAVPGVSTPAAAGALILKAAPGKLFSLQVSSTASGWFLLLDDASIPANGAVQPRRAWPYTAGALDFRFDPPLQMEAGAVVVFSSTGPFALTLGAAAAFISGEIV